MSMTSTIQHFKSFKAPSLEYASEVLPQCFSIEVIDPNCWKITYPDHYCYTIEGQYTGNHLKYIDLLLVDEIRNK